MKLIYAIVEKLEVGWYGVRCFMLPSLSLGKA